MENSIFIPIPKKGNAKECSNYCTSALISHASKVMLKILQARLQKHVHCELPDTRAGFRKGRGTRDHIANIRSVQFSLSVVSNSLRPHESQHARPPCHHHLPEFTQTHVHRVSNAIQPSHPLSSPSPPAPNPSHHQSLFQ